MLSCNSIIYYPSFYFIKPSPLASIFSIITSFGMPDLAALPLSVIIYTSAVKPLGSAVFQTQLVYNYLIYHDYPLCCSPTFSSFSSFKLHVTTYISSHLGIHVLPVELFHSSRSPSSLYPRFLNLFFFSLLRCIISNVRFFCLFLILSTYILCYQHVRDFLPLPLLGLPFSSPSHIRLSIRSNPWFFSCLLSQPTPMLFEYLTFLFAT